MVQPAGKDSVSVASSCPPDNIRPGQRSGWQEVATWVRLLVGVVAVLVVVVA